MAATPETTVGEHGMRGIVAGRACHSAAGMGAGTAQIQALQRHPVIRGADHWPRAEELVEAHLAVKDVAADQPEPALEEIGRASCRERVSTSGGRGSFK